jgi:hypothetical protein
MRNRSCIDSIDNYKSAVYLSIYRGWGLDPLHNWFRANSANIANNHSTKLGTLICSAHARTVRPTGADRPDRGPSDLRAGPSAGSLWRSTHPFQLFNVWARSLTSCNFQTWLWFTLCSMFPGCSDPWNLRTRWVLLFAPLICTQGRSQGGANRGHGPSQGWDTYKKIIYIV